MTSSPTTDNGAADVLNGFIGAFFAGGEVAAEAFLTALDPPLLANPLGQWLLAEGVGYVGQILSIAGQRFGDALVIDLQTGSEKSNVLNAATTLALAQASGDQTAIDSAVASADAAWKSVTNFDGWSTPK